ncbi:MAG: carbohydrate ABC transporter permease [Phycisphaerales bacterium]
MNGRDAPSLAVRIAVHAMVWAVALSMLAPFAWSVATSLKTDAEATRAPTLATLLPSSPQWGNYVRAMRDAELGRFFLNSVIVAVVTTVLAVAHNALAGYAFAKLRFRGADLLFGIALATMMLPTTVSFLFAYLVCERLGYVDNLQALIVPFLASGFGIFYMRQVIRAVPDSLLDAARIDGLRDLEIFWVIVRPAAWQGIAALAILSFINSWNSFFWPLVAIDSPRHKTLPLAIADLSAGLYVQSWPVQTAAATIMVAPLIVIFFLTQRAFVRGITFTGLKES